MALLRQRILAGGRPLMPDEWYVWYWRRRLPERKGKLCQVVARGAKGSILVRFPDGYEVITSRHAVRRVQRTTPMTEKKIHVCPDCGMAESALDEVRRRLKQLRVAAEKTTTYAEAQRSLIPHYEAAEAALVKAEDEWRSWHKRFFPKADLGPAR